MSEHPDGEKGAKQDGLRCEAQSKDINPTASSIASANSQAPCPSPAPLNSPAPLLRPPIPGSKSSGPRTPRLGLAIPPSPNQKAVSDSRPVPILPPLSQIKRPSSRPTAPQLRLATPSGGNHTPQETRPPPQSQPNSSAGGISDGSGHSRSDSFTMVDGKNSNPTSASSSGFSAYDRHPTGTPNPASAISSVYSEAGGTALEREGSNHVLPDLEKLSLEKGRTLDIEDLDDDGWRAASEQKRIVELGSLGEGAGGAVTRCKLVGGKTEFALKVCRPYLPYHVRVLKKCCRLSPPTPIRTSRSR